MSFVNSLNSFKSIAFGFIMLLFGIAGQAQSTTPLDASSKIQFSIKNFGITTTGTFNGLQGKINFDPNNPAVCFFDVSIDAASINTGVSARDNHLKKEEYFFIDKYPKITFASTKVIKTASSYTIIGNLAIKGVVKVISFPFSMTPSQNGYVFTGEFTINRRDFKVGSSSLVLGDNVHLSLKIFAK